MLVAVPITESAAEPVEWEGPLTAEEQSMIDRAWEIHKAAGPASTEPVQVTDADQESDGDFLARIGTDGQKWAWEFLARDIDLDDIDEGLMIGWFANAIEAGRTAGIAQGRAEAKAEIARLREALAKAGPIYAGPIGGELGRKYPDAWQCVIEFEPLNASCAYDLQMALADIRHIERGKHNGAPSPGSVLSDGSVIDYLGVAQFNSAFIPDDLDPAMKGELGQHGWCKTPSAKWPSVLPVQGVTHIFRTEAKP